LHNEKFGPAAARTPARLHPNEADDRLAQALVALSLRFQLVDPGALTQMKSPSCAVLCGA
jgi:hypothetical protein